MKFLGSVPAMKHFCSPRVFKFKEEVRFRVPIIRPVAFRSMRWVARVNERPIFGYLGNSFAAFYLRFSGYKFWQE